MRTMLALSIVTAGALAVAGCSGGSDVTAPLPASSQSVESSASSASNEPGATSSARASASEKAAKVAASATDGTARAATSKPATSNPAPSTKKPKPKETPPPAPTAGSYVTYDQYAASRSTFAGTDVVLFFHAPWCPKCQDTEQSIKSDGVPAGLTIVKTDFDSSTALRQKYGVTVQHTYVQIDSSGNTLKKWTGSYGDTSVGGIASKTV